MVAFKAKAIAETSSSSSSTITYANIPKNNSSKEKIILFTTGVKNNHEIYYQNLSKTNMTINNISNLTHYSDGVGPAKLVVHIIRNITPFNHGTIEYETKIDKGYGGPISSGIELTTTTAAANETNSSSNNSNNSNSSSSLSLGIYHNNSSYTPNNYLLLQNDNGKSQVEQRPLNQTIEYGKWYKVKLNINSTSISFYFDGRPITTWIRPSDKTYTNIKLIGESADVSFRNLVMVDQNNHQFSNLFGASATSNIKNNNNNNNKNLSGWKITNSTNSIIPVNSEINVSEASAGGSPADAIKIGPEAIIVTHPQENLLVVAKFGKFAQLLKEIYFPDGTVALSIFLIH
jgi:hypothetical protein